MEALDSVCNKISGRLFATEDLSVPDSGIFEKPFRPCEITEDFLKGNATQNRKAIFHATRRSGDEEVDEVVYTKHLKKFPLDGWSDQSISNHFQKKLSSACASGSVNRIKSD